MRFNEEQAQKEWGSMRFKRRFNPLAESPKACVDSLAFSLRPRAHGVRSSPVRDSCSWVSKRSCQHVH